MKTTNAKSPFSYRNTAIILGVVVVTVFLLLRIIHAIQKAKEYDKVSNDANARLAFLIRQACNPWGSIAGLSTIDIDGTDDEELFALAAQIKDLNAVRSSYKKQFAEELLDRLSAELDRQDLDRWLNLAGNTATVAKPIPNKSLVFAKQAVTMYDADDSRKVVKTYQSGDKIGIYETELTIRHSNGSTYTYVRVIWDKGWIWDSKGLVRKDFVKIA